MQDKEILDFWSWFAKNSTNLQSDRYDKIVLDELDNLVSNWDLGWEIGPGESKENSLTISPNGNKDLLGKTNRIISKAPKLGNWEFYSTKQSKENWHLARLFNVGFEIDASDWKYVLLKYEDEKVEILVKADTLSDLNKETKGIAADLVLTNLLGEKLKIQTIDFITIVDDFDDENGITELKYLPEHITDKNYFNS
ncbi:hypothetical protein [Lacibacter sp. H407]|uniref:hypothetical protein n=1 Tax=Lacibacter sp. H407 TaxID=3133423 RepID=UPI0030C1B585